MSVWIQNLQNHLEKHPVIILHGNVRDRYIDGNGRVYQNLSHLLRELGQRLSISFQEWITYDPMEGEQIKDSQGVVFSDRRANPGEGDLAGTAPKGRQPEGKSGQETPKIPVTRTLGIWREKLQDRERNRFVIFNYLDKAVAYRAHYYTDEEKEIVLLLEKLIQGMGSNHRLILIALQDSMVPVELYTHSPRTCVFPIPMPDQRDRLAYLKHRWGDSAMYRSYGELVADLTDGLFLWDVHNIADLLRTNSVPSEQEVRKLVNKYRLGEQEDHWATLSIEKINGAMRWFIEQEGVKAQDHAIRKVIDVLCIARSGLSGMGSGTASKPRGVLFFAGPTGVGKTLVAKKLAKFLFGTEEAFIRFDMSEFKEEHTVSKLIGSPPGYVGYEEGGALTNAVRARPFSVILFDEIEKAHPKVMDIFLQMLDEGRLTDSRGQTVFFTETVIIFTSNLGTRTHNSRGHPIGERADLEQILQNPTLTAEARAQQIRDHFVRCVENFFVHEISRPELLNRIGNNIVPFNYILTKEDQILILNAHLRRIQREFEERFRHVGFRCEFPSELAEWFVERWSSRMAQYGGRGIANALDNELIPILARAVLRAEHFGRTNSRFRVVIHPDQLEIQIEAEGG